jgi:hypothetical protein
MMQTSQPIPALADMEALIDAYEELRRRFLSRQQGPGLTLFMRRGMREWINAYSLYDGSPPVPVLTTPNDHAALPYGVVAEVVLILAGMLLHDCHEARR